MKRRCRGQSTLEYILVLAAILVALIAVVGKTMKTGVENTLTDAGNNITNASKKVSEKLGL